MSTRKDDYYDEEARVYSEKRYPSVAQNYVHFLFTHRRDLVLTFLKKVIEETPAPRTLLEVGCADGILLRSIEDLYPGAFHTMLGVDLSKSMVGVAQSLTRTLSITYIVRNELSPINTFNVVLEIGVAALALDTRGEIKVLADQLVEGGYLLCSFGGRTSIASRLARGASGDNSVLRPYHEYERMLCERFSIILSRPYGLYVPLLWRIPVLARLLQPVVEVLGLVVPNLCHERLYLLKKLPAQT
ncbi:MAG: methyltransferase domain-containing protein [Minisyncoccia bacterium]